MNFSKTIPDGPFHAIVIGAGVNGLAAGVNLAAAGIKTLIVERSHCIGGQAVTEESLLPGFKLHPHANYLSYQQLLDRQPDAASRAMPRNTVMPLAQHGLAFRDGRPPVILYRRELLARTRQSLAVFSRHDARAFQQVKGLADQLTKALADIYFSPPYAASIAGYAKKIAGVYAGMFDARRLGTRSAQQVIDALFESDEVRTLFYRLTLEFSGSFLEEGSDIAFLGYVLWLLGRRTLPLGGMASVPNALAAAARDAGASIVCGVDIDRISARNGTVDGVFLSDGTHIPAAIVVSSADYGGSMGTLLSGAAPGVQARQQLASYAGVQAGMIGSYSACLARAPEYRSGRHQADINRCAQVFIGLDSTAEVIGHVSDMAAGRLPQAFGAVRMNSLWDPSQSPAGQYAAGADCPFPGGLDAALCEEVEAGFPAAFADTWAEYAPNLQGGILAHQVRLSSDRARKIALREGADQYRGPVPGYYLCGASTHPGGGVHGACGVNAVKVILREVAG
ncbi:MAG: NAD(P)/FAD-dependent oxidoreductase [Pseudomonadota bacterium]